MQTTPDTPKRPVHYPSSDGEPMAEDTLQYDWIVTIKENLEVLLTEDFVAADLFWYPIEGDNRTRRAPDVMVALGRPKGRRGSFLQWKEGGRPPEVVFEVWSHRNTFAQMVEKLRWYERFGVSEFYAWDPNRGDASGWVRGGSGSLEPLGDLHGWTSPLLGIRFELEDAQLVIRFPDGRPFATAEEMRQANRPALEEAARADQEAARADQEAARADQEAARAEALAAQLRALGVDPEAG